MTERAVHRDPTRQARERALIEEAEADLTAGRIMSGEAMKAWLKDWVDGKDVPDSDAPAEDGKNT